MKTISRLTHSSRSTAFASALLLAFLATSVPATTASASAVVQQEALSVNVYTITGIQIPVTGLTSASTVLDLKEALQDLEGVPVCAQLLVYQGVKMLDERTLGSYGITDGATIHLVMLSYSC